MTKKKYTIKDIAQMAGVSKGTVDRVLHKRGKVSEDAHQRVQTILNQIDYHPNPIARNLKKNKVYRICVLMPDWRIDPYWEPAEQGIQQAIEEFKPFGVTVDKFFYHPHEKLSFSTKANDILGSTPDVLVMVPLFQEESIKILEECKEKNIRVALFNNHINTLNNEIFVGQDLYQSGKVAAGLIDKVTRCNAKIVVAHLDKEAHMELKEDGFKSYFKEKKHAQVNLISQSFQTDNNDKFNSDVSAFLELHQDICAIFVTNSKAHKLINILKCSNSKITVVGYDLLEENIDCLRKGQIEFLIHQKPKRQAYLGICYFVEYFLFGKEVPTRMLLPIDIITSENVGYYLD
ncbi:LacI family transcriptional regulator [Flavobacteriaceae bacterium MAR_2009_75]|nr:LacI family transcriptional regulator [Flavobacteriaceae bacterium MAR_2009_75]